MDVVSSLTLMISFGMLVAFMMSDKNQKNNPFYAFGREGIILSLAA